MSKKPETLFKEKALPRFRAIPDSWFEKIQQKAIRGTPDVLGCVGRYFVAIELKTDVGDTDSLQDYNIDKIRRCGAIALVTSPSTIEKDIELILKLTQTQP